MKVVTFIGDPHVYHVPPSSRRDDYPRIILKKLVSVATYSPSDAYICLGDFCHKPILPTEYEVQVLMALAAMGAPVYSIVGNHDVPRGKVDQVYKTSLGVFFKSGLLKRIEKPLRFKVGGTPYCIRGADWEMGVSKTDGTCEEVFCTHAFYQQTHVKTDEFKLTDDLLSQSGVKHVVLGHDHAKYEIHENKYGQKIYRPGSLGRGTAHYYNLKREISVLRMEFYEERVKADYVTIPTAPVKEAFKRRVLEPKQPSGRSMVAYLKEFLAAEVSTKAIFKIFDSMEIQDSDIRSYVENLLVSNGFIRAKEDRNE